PRAPRHLSSFPTRRSSDLTRTRLLNIHVVSKRAEGSSIFVSAVRAGKFPSCGAPIPARPPGDEQGSTHLVPSPRFLIHLHQNPSSILPGPLPERRQARDGTDTGLQTQMKFKGQFPRVGFAAACLLTFVYVTLRAWRANEGGTTDLPDYSETVPRDRTLVEN